MVIWIPQLLQRLRRSRTTGLVVVVSVLLTSVLGNAVTFYYFDGASDPEISLWDALWYSLISVSTVGYGDLYATSTGARLGTLFFVVVLGLSAFSAFLGLIIDAMMNLNHRELHGLSKIYSEGHILLIHFPCALRVERIIRELRQDPEYKDVEIVLINNTLETLPFDVSGVRFVKGSPLQIETLERAGLRSARIAIILCTSQSDPDSDGKVASVLTMVEHLHPDIKTIAECLDERHDILFGSTNCDSIVYTNQVINNLLVQETQDRGVAALVTELTDNGQGHTLYSAQVTSRFGEPYGELSGALNAGARLISVERDGAQVLEWDDLTAEADDTVIYIAKKRLRWGELLG